MTLGSHTGSFGSLWSPNRVQEGPGFDTQLRQSGFILSRVETNGSRVHPIGGAVRSERPPKTRTNFSSCVFTRSTSRRRALRLAVGDILFLNELSDWLSAIHWFWPGSLIGCRRYIVCVRASVVSLYFNPAANERAESSYQGRLDRNQSYNSYTFIIIIIY